MATALLPPTAPRSRPTPAYVEAHHNLGNALQARGDREGALAAYGAALRLDPGCFARIVNSLAAHRSGECGSISRRCAGVLPASARAWRESGS